MKLKNSQLLIIRQLDKKMLDYTVLHKQLIPKNGWINQLRLGLNMSLRQLGERLSMTPQGIKDIEKREMDETITLKSLKETGEALNLKLVYGFVPKDSSLEQMIENRARELAVKIVKRTSTTMKLEDQENTSERLKQAVEEMTQQIKREMPKTLWD